MEDYIDLTDVQKEKLTQCFCHDKSIIGKLYIPHENSRGNGYMVFIYDKKKILCESNVKYFREAARKSKTTFTIELYEGDWISVRFFAAY